MHDFAYGWKTMYWQRQKRAQEGGGGGLKKKVEGKKIWVFTDLASF